MYPKSYLDYLIHFHVQRDYFECHEVLEAYWKEEKNPDLRLVWQGLIQLAVSLYHQRRGNFSGAEKLMKRSLSLLQQERETLEQLGLFSHQLLQLINKRLNEIRKKKTYESVNLPLKKELLQICQAICQEKEWEWGKPCDVTNRELVHKHILRDRSEVLSEREKEKRRREQERNS